MYYIYILKSKIDHQFYTGLTNDLNRRIKEHNACQVQATKNRVPLELVYYETVDTLQQARGREKWYKTGEGREFRNQILNNIPR